MLNVEKSQGLNKVKHYDWIFLLIVLSLCAYGLLMAGSVARQLNDFSLLIKQGLGMGIGFVCMVTLSLIDYKDFRILGYFAYGFSTFLLILVLIIGFGQEETGSKAWLDLGPITYQPSELGKVTFVIINALFLENIVTQTGKYNYFKLLFFSAIPMGLVFLQPDYGTGIVYAFVFLCMVFFAGIPYKYIFIGLGVTGASLPIVYYTGLYQMFPSHIQNRFSSFFNQEADPLGKNYQVRLSIQYAGSGQLWGRGWGEGWAAETVPYAHTDFIFSVVAEEMGFVGSAVLIILFLAFFSRCIYISWYSREQYGSFIVMGLTAMIFAHFLENIGMAIGLMPVTGIPLPFISYGASSVLTNLMAIGIILSISLRKQRPMFEY